jgi:hypothetical protein
VIGVGYTRTWGYREHLFYTSVLDTCFNDTYIDYQQER